MIKAYFIEQPPISEKFSFIVDDINEFGTRGYTKDISKIKYNLQLIPENLRDDLKIGMLLKEKGAITVFPFGRYFIRLTLNVEETEGTLNMFDFKAIDDLSELSEIIKVEPTDSIKKMWENAFNFLRATYEEDESDIVKMVRIKE
jgi:hypothetical protein